MSARGPARARLAVGLVTLAAAFGCAPSETASPSNTLMPTPTATATLATATPSPSPSPTPTPTPTPTPAPTPSPSPTPRPTPTPVGPAAYCKVDDILTPNRDYDATADTYLDWTYMVPESYVPPDLVSALSGEQLFGIGAVEALSAADVLARRGDPAYTTLLSDAPLAVVRSTVYRDLAALRAAAAQAGRPIVILSAYRSFAVQRMTFDYWVSVGGYEQALRTSARPGHSEHQLGTVLDFGDGIAAPWEYADWATTPTGAWIAAHAADYGFVMSYPKGKTPVTCYDYEPWHYRWVGNALAQQLAQSALSLREHQADITR